MWDDASLLDRRPSSAGACNHNTFNPLSDEQVLPELTEEEVSAFFSCPDFQVGALPTLGAARGQLAGIGLLRAASQAAAGRVGRAGAVR